MYGLEEELLIINIFLYLVALLLFLIPQYLSFFNVIHNCAKRWLLYYASESEKALKDTMGAFKNIKVQKQLLILQDIHQMISLIKSEKN